MVLLGWMCWLASSARKTRLERALSVRASPCRLWGQDTPQLRLVHNPMAKVARPLLLATSHSPAQLGKAR